jgi:hypothetical protein
MEAHAPISAHPFTNPVRTRLRAGGNRIRTLGPGSRKGESLSRKGNRHRGDKRRSRNGSPPLPGALSITARAPKWQAPCVTSLARRSPLPRRP